jgi:adenine specific DNA methylase Mod
LGYNAQVKNLRPGGHVVVRSIDENTLFYGDNLSILREYIPSESIDLIYLDPPFNSSRNYNVLFKDESGTESEVVNALKVRPFLP